MPARDLTSGLWNIIIITCFIFPHILNNNPNWLIFFRGVETTNQYIYMILYWFKRSLLGWFVSFHQPMFGEPCLAMKYLMGPWSKNLMNYHWLQAWETAVDPTVLTQPEIKVGETPTTSSITTFYNYIYHKPNVILAIGTNFAIAKKRRAGDCERALL